MRVEVSIKAGIVLLDVNAKSPPLPAVTVLFEVVVCVILGLRPTQTLRQIGRIGIVTEPPPAPDESLRQLAAMAAEVRRILGRALCIRAVDAGSCNGCELEMHALNNAIYNLEGLGIRFVASPRHADMLLVTGPVARHMQLALRRTWEATADPKWVVAIGECACTGGIFGESYASCGRVANVIPVDVAVPGCPPSPMQILSGILTAISG